MVNGQEKIGCSKDRENVCVVLYFGNYLYNPKVKLANEHMIESYLEYIS